MHLREERLRQEMRRMAAAMQAKEEEIRRGMECGVCLDRAKNCAFNCGHQACFECAQHLDKCPICSTAIFSRTKVFN